MMAAWEQGNPIVVFDIYVLEMEKSKVCYLLTVPLIVCYTNGLLDGSSAKIVFVCNAFIDELEVMIGMKRDLYLGCRLLHPLCQCVDNWISYDRTLLNECRALNSTRSCRFLFLLTSLNQRRPFVARLALLLVDATRL